MSETEPRQAWNVANRAVPEWSDFTRWIGTRAASSIESTLGDDLLATFGRLLTTSNFKVAAAAFNQVWDRLGLTADEFTDLNGYPTELGEVIHAAGVAFGPNEDRDVTAVHAVQDQLVGLPTALAGKVKSVGLREVLRDAGDRYAARYGVTPDPDSLEKVAGAYVKARELYRTAASSRLTRPEYDQLTAHHNAFDRAILAVERKAQRVGTDSTFGLRRPQREARNALSALSGPNAYAQRSR